MTETIQPKSVDMLALDPILKPHPEGTERTQGPAKDAEPTVAPSLTFKESGNVRGTALTERGLKPGRVLAGFGI